MSSLWTPGGERPVGRPRPESAPAPASSSPPSGSAAPPPGELGEPTAEQLEELRRRLAETPASVVITNHAFGLFELAALHLSLEPPQLEEARLAIDALGALVEGLAGRLGEGEAAVADGLAQLRLAFVQIKAASEHPEKTAGTSNGG